MGRWGWRPLVVSTFMSVWVAGCNLLSDSAAATQPPSPYPPVTLTVGRASRASPPSPTLAFLMASPVAFEPPPAADNPLPTPSPTSSVYVVLPGDTALGIALRAGIDLQALRGANGGQTLSILTIGQSLVIPPPDGSATQVARLPTSVPLALRVEPPACMPIGMGESLCLGRIVNEQSVAAAHVEIGVLAQGPGGAAARETLALEQDILPAGGWAPYRVRLPFAPDEITSLVVEVSSADPADPPAAVDVRDPQLEYRDGYAAVRATLGNPAAALIVLERVVVSLQAPDGRLIGYRVVPLDVRLGPNQTTSFEALVVAVGEQGQLPRVTIHVDARAES